MAFPVYIKAGKTRLSIAKEIREVNRLRIGYEKGMQRKLQSLFLKTARQAAKAYEVGSNIEAATSDLEAELGAVFRATYTSVIDKFASRVTENRKAESQFQSLIFQYYAREGASKVRGVAATTRRGILKAIQLGETEALGVDKTAKLIVDRTGGTIGRSRAATIARTETHAAASFATDEANRELGLPAQKKRWVSVGDARTRPSHAAANGQEVGIDEPFIIRDKGAEIEMKYPHDGSGGASNNINCRCLAVYFTDEDDLFDDGGAEIPVEPVAPAVPVVPDAPVVSIPDDPFGPNVPFVLPRNTALNDANIPIPKKRESLDKIHDYIDSKFVDPKVQREINEYVGINWTGRNPSMIGSVKLSKATPRALAYVAQTVQELEYMGKYMGVIPLRGIVHGRGNRNGDQGGGVMGLNKEAINSYADAAEGKIPDYDDLVKKQDAVRAEFREAKMAWWEHRQDNYPSNMRPEDYVRMDNDPIRKRYDDLSIQYKEIANQFAITDNYRRRGGENVPYKIGDDLSKRPWSTKSHFTDNLDKTRALMYHEFGHHIHQTYKLKERYRRGENYLEGKLTKFWKSKEKSELDYYAPSKYAMTNQYEYFVESFAMYMMDRTDLIHPEMKTFIDDLIKERGQ